jgi:hypothetical protein
MQSLLVKNCKAKRLQKMGTRGGQYCRNGITCKKTGGQHCRNDSHLYQYGVVNIARSDSYQMILSHYSKTGWSTSSEQVVRMIGMGGQDAQEYTLAKNN